MWLTRRLLRRRGDSSIDSNAALLQLQQKLSELQAANHLLKQQLQAAHSAACEYLYVYRPVALPLLGPEWALRYLSLSGTSIRYWKSSKDTHFSPREEYSIVGCTVEWHGRQGTRLWVWTLVDPGGTVLLKVGSPSETTALKWVTALEEAGCARRNACPVASRQASEASSSLTSSTSLPPSLQRFEGGTAVVAPSHLFAHDTAQEASSPAGDAGGSGQAQAAQQVRQRRRPQPAGGDELTATPAPATEAQNTRTSQSAQLPPHDVDPAPPSHGVGGVAPAARRQNTALLASTPVHTQGKPSYLSSERMWHEKQSGLINLMIVVLVATNFRLALENALKYGWRYNPIAALRDLTIGNPNIPLALCYPAIALLALMSLGVELLAHTLMKRELQVEAALTKQGVATPKAVSRHVAALRALHEGGLFVVCAVITSAVLAVPCVVISSTQAEPISAGVLICLAVIWWMKLVSMHHCCADFRAARRAGEVSPGERGSPATPPDQAVLAYPEDLTVSHLGYFLAAPTLCYQVNYPRTSHIRWKWLARRVAELVVMLTVLSLIVQQYMQPAIANSMRPLKQMDWLRLCERLLKLALPNTYCWLVMFYCLFHLWLNILAELLRFGDREYYKDWWNAPTLGEYWRTWNQPVHKWLLRHVYYPAIRMGLSRGPAMLLVFLVSAVFHELVLGVPLHCVRLWAFSGIMLQVPLILATEHIRKWLNRDEAGNICFWLTFCVVGQPLSILLYAHDWLYAVKPTLNLAGGAGLATNTTLPGLGVA